MPNSLLYKGFRNGRVKLNGKKAAPEARLAEGDLVELYLNDEFFPSAPATTKPADGQDDVQTPAFQTVFENRDIAAIYKPAGLLCHGDAPGAPSLLRSFTMHMIRQKEYDPAAENSFAPALCNRLDRNTEGLVLVAKTYPALRDANELIRQDHMKKTYLCVTVGTPPEGIHEAFLVRDKASHTVRVSATEPDAMPSSKSKPIATGIKTLECAGPLCLCEIALITGRTHQIRAHLAFLGAPLLGDAKYGTPSVNRQYAVRHQLLCAWRLSFPPPLPESNTLHYLAGKSFTSPGTLPRDWWREHRQKKDGQE